MAFNGVLEIDNKSYNLLHWNLRLTQRTDKNGRPMANPQGGQISITIESSGSNDFFEWAVSPDMTKNGKIIFLRRDNSSSLKTFEFKNAYCIDYDEEFDSVSSGPMRLRLKISALELKSGSTTLNKNWDKATLR